MAVRSTLTNSGIEILAKSQSEMGGQYWIGYFSLAYVPQEWKDTIDKVYPSMTKLTTYGDIIYNVWQGDLLGNSFINSKYNQNVKTHYRYVLDTDNINNLVVWELNPDYEYSIGTQAGQLKFLGKHVYTGTEGGEGVDLVESKLPIPASLYYLGDVAGNGSDTNSLIDIVTADSIFTPSASATTVALDNIEIPRVSMDLRAYAAVALNEPTAAGAYFDTNPIPSISSDYSAWYSYESTLIDYANDALANELHMLCTISNYNRYHSVSSENSINFRSEIKANNISKATKYFQISDFSVINSNEVVTSTGEKRIAATGIKVIMSLNIAPSITEQGWDDDGEYTATENEILEDTYGETPSNPNDLFSTKHSSFKFNRAGVYAVKVRKVVECDEASLSATINKDKVTYEIDPDVEPVLFAVVDWDNTQIISETGDPSPEFEIEVSINLSAYDDGLGDSSLIRDNIVFYNLYESDAIKFYKNQLIMNAQTLHSINVNSLEITNIKRSVSTLTNKVNAISASKLNIGAENIPELSTGVSVYAGLNQSTGNLQFKKIEGRGGVSVYEQNNTILIDSGGVVVSNASNITNTSKKSLAYFEQNSVINSTGSSITIEGSKLNLDGQFENTKYEDAGIVINGKMVTSGGLIETVVAKVNTSTVIPKLVVYLKTDLDIEYYDLLRSVHWSMSECQTTNYTVRIFKDVTAPAVSEDLIQESTHNHESETSGILVEPIHFNDSDFSTSDYQIIFEDLDTVTDITVYAVYERIYHNIV